MIGEDLSVAPSTSRRSHGPDFIGIGAQKAGTSWLAMQLSRHPGIWMAPCKEVHYFDRNLAVLGSEGEDLRSTREDPQRRKPLLRPLPRPASPGAVAWWKRHSQGEQHPDWYRGLFAEVPPAIVAGEITPRYALCDDAEIAHMRSVAPNARLLFLVRHPVERFWSQCLMRTAAGNSSLDPDALLAFFDSPLGRLRGSYAETLVRFSRRFDPTSILLVFQEAIARDPARLLRQVFAFLGVPDLRLPDGQLAERINRSPAAGPMPAEVRQVVEVAYAAEIQRMASVFGSHALSWLESGPAPVCDPPGSSTALPPTIRLTRDLVTRLESQLALSP